MQTEKPLSILMITGRNSTDSHHVFPHNFEGFAGKLHAYKIGGVKFIPSSLESVSMDVKRNKNSRFPNQLFSLENLNQTHLLLGGAIELTAESTNLVAKAYERCGCVAIIDFQIGRDDRFHVGFYMDNWNRLNEWLNYWLPKEGG